MTVQNRASRTLGKLPVLAFLSSTFSFNNSKTRSNSIRFHCAYFCARLVACSPQYRTQSCTPRFSRIVFCSSRSYCWARKSMRYRRYFETTNCSFAVTLVMNLFLHILPSAVFGNAHPYRPTPLRCQWRIISNA
jgi:hypothetical protein